MSAGAITTTHAATRWVSRGMVAKDWAELSAVMDAFAKGAQCDPGSFRVETVAFRGNVYTIEYLPASKTDDVASGQAGASPRELATASGGPHPAVRVGARTACPFSCEPARDAWTRFIGTLSRLLGRVTGRFDAARREAIGYEGLFESCERGLERYVRLKLSGWVAMRRPVDDIEAVFSDRGVRGARCQTRRPIRRGPPTVALR